MKQIEHLFSNYYLPKVEIKDFNVLIYEKSSFDLSVKNKEEVYEKIIEMSRNNDYTTGNLLNFPYYKNNEISVAIDFNKQINLKDPQQINFIGKTGKWGATSLNDQKKQPLNFYKTLWASGENRNTEDSKFVK